MGNCGTCTEIQRIQEMEAKASFFTYRYEAAIVTIPIHPEWGPKGANTRYGYPLRFCPECGREINPWPLTLEELRSMEGLPVWILVIDRPDLSAWHFIVRDHVDGLVAKDARGAWADGDVTGCCYRVEQGINYGVTWLAFRGQPQGKEAD